MYRKLRPLNCPNYTRYPRTLILQTHSDTCIHPWYIIQWNGLQHHNISAFTRLSPSYYIKVIPDNCLPHPPGLQSLSGGWKCRCNGYRWSQLSHSQLTSFCKVKAMNIIHDHIILLLLPWGDIYPTVAWNIQWRAKNTKEDACCVTTKIEFTPLNLQIYL